MVVVPAAIACSRPVEFTCAIAGAEDDQVTKLVMFSVCPLTHLPVAVSCCCSPAGSDGLAGVTEIETRPVIVPIPDKPTLCGLVLALSAMLRVPRRLPGAVGVKVAEIVQVAPAARVFGDRGQLAVCAKSPVVDKAEMVRATD